MSWPALLGRAAEHRRVGGEVAGGRPVRHGDLWKDQRRGEWALCVARWAANIVGGRGVWKSEDEEIEGMLGGLGEEGGAGASAGGGEGGRRARGQSRGACGGEHYSVKGHRLPKMLCTLSASQRTAKMALNI